MPDKTRIAVLGGGYISVETTYTIHNAIIINICVELTIHNKYHFHTLMTE